MSWSQMNVVSSEWSQMNSLKQGRRNGGALRGHSPLPLHTSIISNFMIYQDPFEANLLQQFTHT